MPSYIYRLNTKICLTMLSLSGFELYSRWVSLLLMHFKCLTVLFQNIIASQNSSLLYVVCTSRQAHTPRGRKRYYFLVNIGINVCGVSV